ncbi:MAG: SPOR domain-containing protein [Sphingomonadales bacterium]|nr:SPOR domain-containing protein [Sphingomonadales bacterium]
MKRLLVALLLAAAGSTMVAPARAASDISALQARAQAGDAEAQFQMGEAYRAGKGVAADQEAAIMWYRRATAQGHVRASEELGFALFAHGDRHEAMPYIEKAAARGEARAFYLLGTAHFNGDYTSRDWPLAYAQTERAAAAGLPAAQKNLEVMDHYLLPADKAKAEQILATLPVVRTTPPNGTSAPVRITPAPVQTASAAPKPDKSVKPPKSTPATAQVADGGGKGSKVADGNDKPAAARTEGNWKVQLGAFGSEDRARDRWKTLKAKVAELGAHQQHIVSAGTIQRLQATGIASRADAQALCKKVTAAGGDCLVIAP